MISLCLKYALEKCISSKRINISPQSNQRKEDSTSEKCNNDDATTGNAKGGNKIKMNLLRIDQ